MHLQLIRACTNASINDVFKVIKLVNKSHRANNQAHVHMQILRMHLKEKKYLNKTFYAIIYTHAIKGIQKRYSFL